MWNMQEHTRKTTNLPLHFYLYFIMLTYILLSSLCFVYLSTYSAPCDLSIRYSVRTMDTTLCPHYGHNIVSALWRQHSVRTMDTTWCSHYGNNIVFALWKQHSVRTMDTT